MARLEKILNDKESGLGSATSQIASLKEVIDRLKQELNSTRNDLTMTKSKASSIEVRKCLFNLVSLPAWIPSKFCVKKPSSALHIFIGKECAPSLNSRIMLASNIFPILCELLLQAEYQKLKLQHEAAVKAAETELKTKLEKLAEDLDGKWTETLR